MPVFTPQYSITPLTVISIQILPALQAIPFGGKNHFAEIHSLLPSTTSAVKVIKLKTTNRLKITANSRMRARLMSDFIIMTIFAGLISLVRTYTTEFKKRQLQRRFTSISTLSTSCLSSFQIRRLYRENSTGNIKMSGTRRLTVTS